MNLVLVGLASAVVVGLLAREYIRQRRVLTKVRPRPGLSRADFTGYFVGEGIPAEVSTAVFDSLVAADLTVDPDDDLCSVYEFDQELFLDSLAGLHKSTGLKKRVLDAAWKEYGNVSTVRDLVGLVALAWRRREHA
jgi:hypothetical protein